MVCGCVYRMNGNGEARTFCDARYIIGYAYVYVVEEKERERLISIDQGERMT